MFSVNATSFSEKVARAHIILFKQGKEGNRHSPFILRTNIRKLVSSYLAKVTPQEKTADRMLNSTTHLN